MQIPHPGKSAAGIDLSVELWGDVLSVNRIFFQLKSLFFSLKIIIFSDILAHHAGVTILPVLGMDFTTSKSRFGELVRDV